MPQSSPQHLIVHYVLQVASQRPKPRLVNLIVDPLISQHVFSCRYRPPWSRHWRQPSQALDLRQGSWVRNPCLQLHQVRYLRLSRVWLRTCSLDRINVTDTSQELFQQECVTGWVALWQENNAAKKRLNKSTERSTASKSPKSRFHDSCDRNDGVYYYYHTILCLSSTSRPCRCTYFF